MILSKLFEALICLGFGVGVGVGEADGLAEVGAAAGVGEAASVAGSSSPQPNRNSSEAVNPRTAATLTGDEGTGEPYPVVGYDLAGLDRHRTSRWISCPGARRHPCERIACQVSLPTAASPAQNSTSASIARAAMTPTFAPALSPRKRHSGDC